MEVMVLNLIHLGRIDYANGLAIQKQLVEARHADQIGNTLLLLEHPPVLTLGRNSDRKNIVASDEFLARRGFEIHEINRGGDVTYHGPGQLVGYPILDLRSFTPRLGAVEYVRLLEEALIRACGDFGVTTQRVKGRTGVWTVPGGSIEEKKIAAIGVHIARGITDRAVTSLDLEVDADSTLHPPATLENAIHAAARHFGRVFDHQVLWLESLENLGLAEPAVV